jgi:hypothetical protein
LPHDDLLQFAFFYSLLCDTWRKEQKKNARHFKNGVPAFLNAWKQALRYLKRPANSTGKNMLGKVPSDYTKKVGAGL